MSTVVMPSEARVFVEPEGPYEIIDGRIVEKRHSVYDTWLINLFGRFLESHTVVRERGQVLPFMLFDLHPATDNSRCPDLAFLSSERWPREQPPPRQVLAWPVVPDLAVEIIDPMNLAAEVKAKIRAYFLAGVRRVWVVYPSTEEIEDYSAPTSVRIVQRGDMLDCEALWPGVRIAVDRVFSPTTSSN